MRVRLSKNLTGNYRKGIEREIMRFRAPDGGAGDHYLWHKHVSGIDLNPHQVAWMNQMDQKGDNHLLIGSRRIRKSFTAAAYLLEEGACLPWSEINVHSPALEQSKRNLRYMADFVLNSEILLAYIDERLGEGLGKEHIEFVNRTLIQAKGQASSIDGLGATHQWYEEMDDMDWETILTRIWPTGSQIKDDHDYGGHKGCFRIVTGTIKGIGNIHRLEHPEIGSKIKFNVLPKLNCWHGVAMGIIPRDDIYLIRSMMTAHQFGRTYLVVYVESSAFYPDKWVRACQDYQYTPVILLLDPEYVFPTTGSIKVGIDCGAAGSGDDSSNWAITFTEKIGGRIYWLYSREWSPNERPDKIRDAMIQLFQYFRPDGGFGDAFDTAFLYDLNKRLYQVGVTRIDQTRYENKAGKDGWDEWFVKPIRFTGPVKHQMHERMQKYIYGRVFVYPALVEEDDRYSVLEKLVNQFGNIKAERALVGYNKYDVLNSLLGDDLVESCIAAVWAHEALVAFAEPWGGSVPSMEIAARPILRPLGAGFLNDTRKFGKPTTTSVAFDALRED